MIMFVAEIDLAKLSRIIEVSMPISETIIKLYGLM